MRIAGVNVGKVTARRARAGDGDAAAVVTMEIDKSGLPLHTDATAKIRPRIFLEGNFFVDLQPGSPSAPTLDDGDTIPVSQTARAGAARPGPHRAAVATRATTSRRCSTSYARGSRGAGGAGYNGSIPYWKPAYRNSARS